MELLLIDFNITFFEDFYMIKCEPNNIYWTNHTEKPNKSNLLNWCEKQLLINTRKIFVTKLKGTDTIVGYGYIDISNDSKAEISYGISENFSRRGLGKQLVKALTSYCLKNYENINEIEAWVLENNIISQKCLISNGYIKTENQRNIYFNPVTSEVNMFKYQYIK